MLDADGRPQRTITEDGAAHHADSAISAVFSADGALLVAGTLRQEEHPSGDPSLDGPGALLLRQDDAAGKAAFTRLEPNPIAGRWSYGPAAGYDASGSAYAAGYGWAALGRGTMDYILICETRP